MLKGKLEVKASLNVPLQARLGRSFSKSLLETTTFISMTCNCICNTKQLAIPAIALNYDQCAIARQSGANCRYVVCRALI